MFRIVSRAAVVVPLAVFLLAGTAHAQQAPAQAGSADPRVKLREPVKKESLDAEGQALYDSIVNATTPYGRGLPTPIGVWMNSPRMAEHVLPLYMYLRFGGDSGDAIYFPVRLVELAILVAAREINSQYQWTSHEPTALKVGLEQAVIDVVKNRKGLDSVSEKDGLGEKEKTIIQFGRELFRERRVSAPTFTKAQQLFTTPGVTDLAGLMAFYEFLYLSSNAAFDIQMAPDAKPLLPMP